MEPFSSNSGTVSGAIGVLDSLLGVLNSALALWIMIRFGISALFAYFFFMVVLIQLLFLAAFRCEVPVLKKVGAESVESMVTVLSRNSH